MQRESVASSLLVATCLCVVCSVLVSSAAVVLKPKQEINKRRQMQQDVLQVAGLYDRTRSVAELFQQVETRLVDLETGEFVESGVVDPDSYDPSAAAKDPKWSQPIEGTADLAGLKRREKYAPVYLVKRDDGALSQMILPIRGKGLWSTVYGFLSLEPDLRTVHGITFYEHGETPGLGGEIENPQWKAKWQGKVVFDSDGAPRIEPFRGEVNQTTADAEHKIDALAGATITTRGVTNMIQYWLGADGFGPFLDKQRPSLQTSQARYEARHHPRSRNI